MTITLSKYEKVSPSIIYQGGHYIWDKPQAIPFEIHPDSPVDLTDYVIEGSLNINFRVELDDPLNHISTSGSIEIDEPTPLFRNAYMVLRLDNLIENVLVIKIFIDDSPEFLGVVDPEQSYYDNIQRTYHLYFYDLFSYVYNNLSKHLSATVINGERLKDKFPYYIEIYQQPNTVALSFFLKTYNSIGDGTAIDLDSVFTIVPSFLESYIVGKVGINDFMDALRMNYGAYAFIDANGVLRLISRNRGELNLGSVDITEDIIDQDYITEYTTPAKYNAVLCTSNIEDPEMQIIPNHLIYYSAEGTVEHLFVYGIVGNEGSTDISMFDYLDARFKISSSYPEYMFFMNRTIEELKTIYGNIITPQNIVKCQVARIDLPILGNVTLNEQDYIIMNMEKFYEEEYSTLELLKKQ